MLSSCERAYPKLNGTKARDPSLIKIPRRCANFLSLSLRDRAGWLRREPRRKLLDLVVSARTYDHGLRALRYRLLQGPTSEVDTRINRKTFGNVVTPWYPGSLRVRRYSGLFVSGPFPWKTSRCWSCCRYPGETPINVREIVARNYGENLANWRYCRWLGYQAWLHGPRQANFLYTRGNCWRDRCADILNKFRYFCLGSSEAN